MARGVSQNRAGGSLARWTGRSKGRTSGSEQVKRPTPYFIATGFLASSTSFSKRVKDFLEPLLYLNVPKPTFNRGKRFVVVVFRKASHERGITIEYVLHSQRDRRAI